MKTTVIFSLMKKSKSIILTRFEDEQWCTDGYGAYNISSLPEFEPQQFLTAIGVEESKKDDYKVNFSEAPMAVIKGRDIGYEDKDLDRSKMLIGINGKIYEPFIAFGRVLLLDIRYLKPLEGMEYILLCRHDHRDGSNAIIAKAGFFTMAVIMPRYLDYDSVKLELGLIVETLKRQNEFEDEIRRTEFYDRADDEPDRDDNDD